jgi:hypothetical protein
VDVLLLELPVVVAVVVATSFTLAQKLVYQAWMLLSPPESAAAVQALSQTPAVPVEKGVR